MKTKAWVCIIGVIVLLCLGLSLWLLQPGQSAAAVRVISEGEVLYTLPLSTDTQIEVTTHRGTNLVTVKGGKVAVTEADCPDGYCMARGYCSGGTQIVCLPNRLVLEFVGEQTIDGISG